MYVKTVNDEKLLKIFPSFKATCFGGNEIKPKALKYVKEELIKLIKHLANLSLNLGCFPDDLKIAIITLINKKQSKRSFTKLETSFSA